ncbi:MAG: CPBP family intramembrane metalloprotease [Oscillospiraceae bacterium]|nr:CPBP family intramembrane metalloprotease [Oscillospiraceae bacterium]
MDEQQFQPTQQSDDQQPDTQPTPPPAAPVPKKQPKPKFQKPLLGALGWFGFAYLICNMVAICAITIDPLDPESERKTLCMSLLLAVGGVIALIIFHKIYERDGFCNFATNGNIKLAALLIIPAILYNLTGIFFATRMPSMRTTILSFQAGIAEEVMFRALPIAYMMRAYKFDEKKVAIPVVVTGVFFGLFHATNMFMGAPLKSTIYQVAACIGIGVLFGAVYMRSGNIIFCMVSHVLQDFIALLNESSVSEDGIMKDIEFTSDVILDIALIAVFIIIGMFYIRKSKRGEIVERWKKIWSYTDETEVPAEPVQIETV